MRKRQEVSWVEWGWWQTRELLSPSKEHSHSLALPCDIVVLILIFQEKPEIEILGWEGEIWFLHLRKKILIEKWVYSTMWTNGSSGTCLWPLLTQTRTCLGDGQKGDIRRVPSCPSMCPCTAEREEHAWGLPHLKSQEINRRAGSGRFRIDYCTPEVSQT